MTIDLSVKEYLCIANSLSILTTIAAQGRDDAVLKGDWDRWREFAGYTAACKKIEKKIRKALEE